MKAVQIHQFGRNAVMKLNKKIRNPVSSIGRVLIEVYAAGVNPHDWKIREGQFQQKIALRFPITLGMDFSGVVIHVDDSVSGFKPGDEVYGQSSLLTGWSGSFAEFISADAKAIALKPCNLSHLQAAALPLAGVSAYRALIEHMKLSQDQKILIHGGAGGVGSIAIQLAKHLGAYVATTVGTADIAFAKKLGADEIIDYKKELFENILRDYDAVLDTVGGTVYKKSLTVLKPSGMVVSLIEKPIPALVEECKVNAIYQMTQVTDERLNELAKFIEQGVTNVPIAKVFSLERASDALTYQQKRHPRGKVVLKVQRFPRIKQWKNSIKKILKKKKED